MNTRKRIKNNKRKINKEKEVTGAIKEAKINK
jgi:hypothetical protein